MASTLRRQLPTRLRELRIHGCQSSEASAPVRQFISKIFPEIKKHNPSLPILIREAASVPPRAIARGPSGHERETSLDGSKSGEEVEQRIAKLLQDQLFSESAAQNVKYDKTPRQGSGVSAA